MNKEIKQKSNCCNAEVKVIGDTTHYYQCTKCNKPCDLVDKEIKKMTPEELIREYYLTTEGLNNFDIDKVERNELLEEELLKRLQNNNVGEFKKELKEWVEGLYPEDIGVGLDLFRKDFIEHFEL